MKKLFLITLLAAVAVLAFAQNSYKITPPDAKSLLAKDKTVLLLDVRTAAEFEASHIAGAKLLPYDTIDAASAKAFIKDKLQTVVVYCRSGHRSGIAASTLVQLGYSHILDLGGIINWPFEQVKGKE